MNRRLVFALSMSSVGFVIAYTVLELERDLTSEFLRTSGFTNYAMWLSNAYLQWGALAASLGHVVFGGVARNLGWRPAIAGIVALTLLEALFAVVLDLYVFRKTYGIVLALEGVYTYFCIFLFLAAPIALAVWLLAAYMRRLAHKPQVR